MLFCFFEIRVCFYNTFCTQVTLLLPLEASFNHEKVTPDFMKDHIALCDGLSRNNAQIVTLSGLRGSIEEYEITPDLIIMLMFLQRNTHVSFIHQHFIEILSRLAHTLDPNFGSLTTSSAPYSVSQHPHLLSSIPTHDPHVLTPSPSKISNLVKASTSTSSRRPCTSSVNIGIPHRQPIRISLRRRRKTYSPTTAFAAYVSSEL